MAIQISYAHQEAGTAHPNAYARVTRVNFAYPATVWVEAAIYHDQAAARGGKTPIATQGYLIPDADLAAFFGPPVWTPGTTIAAQAYLYLRRKIALFAPGADV